MDAARRLTIVSWLYIAIGTYTFMALISGFFIPADKSAINFHFNPNILCLPIGIGLLKRNLASLKLALILNWLMIIFVALAILFFLFVFLTSGGSSSIQISQEPGTWNKIAITIGMLLIGLPVFIWQLRVLMSNEVRALMQ